MQSTGRSDCWPTPKLLQDVFQRLRILSAETVWITLSDPVVPSDMEDLTDEVELDEITQVIPAEVVRELRKQCRPPHPRVKRKRK